MNHPSTTQPRILHRLFGAICCFLALPLVVSAEPSENAEGAESETIVLLHGMGRTRASMWILEKRLEHAGYEVLNFPYEESDKSLAEVSGELKSYIRERVETDRYHLIGHSLGNIVIRKGFAGDYPEGLSRIVMIAPPNRPTPLPDWFRQNCVYRWITGEAGRNLTEPEFYRTLPKPTVEFGVIAGDKGQPVTFDEPNDGVVAVSATRLEGMADFVVVHDWHTFIMNTNESQRQILSFLEHGRFDHR